MGIDKPEEVPAVRFDAAVEERPAPHRPGLWAGFVLPQAVVAELGATWPDGRARKRIPVAGTVAGEPYRGSVYLQADGSWEFITGLELRRRGHFGLGDTVEVVMAEDLEQRVLEPPADVAAALAAAPGTRERWDAEPWSHKRELMLYVDDAKKPETRARRVARVVAMLLDKVPL